MMATEGAFTIAQQRPLRDGMTISRDTRLGQATAVTWFSLGSGTSISPESYDTPAIYLGSAGQGQFLLGPEATPIPLGPDCLLVVPGGTLCGMQSEAGLIYTEILSERELEMTEKLEPGKAIALPDLVPYEPGSVSNLDVIRNDSMKLVVMAFDAGTGLRPHRAPGNALITALEGSAIIGYEGEEYPLQAGESFRFAKNALHSVTASTPFKMSLLLVLD